MTNDEELASVASRVFVTRHSCFVIAAALVALTLLARSTAAADANLADPEAAVEAGKSALRSQSYTPWYDREADNVRPIALPPRRQPSNYDWSWLGDLFSWLGVFGSLGEVMVFLMWLLVAALVVWIVVALLRMWRRAELADVNASAEAATDGAQISRVEALPVAIDKPMTNLLDESRRLAAAGNYAAAIVYLFSHQLVESDTAGALRLRKGKTNRQYLRELRRNRPRQPELPPLLEGTMLVFERAFFGAHSPTEREFERCLAETLRFDELLRATPTEEAA